MFWSLNTLAEIKSVLEQYKDSYTDRTLAQLRAIKRIQRVHQQMVVEIVLGYPAAGIKMQLAADLKKFLAANGIEDDITIDIQWKIEAHAVQPGLQAVAGVKNIIAIASGKGGVGKSTTAVNIALALAKEGATVGILDADIYGPNQPQMLGVSQQPQIENGFQLPIVSHGIQSMSIGYLIAPNTPMIWRGPMVSQALQQLLHNTRWEQLDYLIIDLPPGTGDIQLTLAQKVPVSAAVIVTTPQDIALLDARKGLEMFRKVKVPVLGVIENMSGHVCSQCGHKEPIFGQGGAQRMAQECEMNLLGQLPLDISIRENADAGHPTVVVDPEGTLATLYRDIARKIAAGLSLQTKNFAAKFPKIVIE